MALLELEWLRREVEFQAVRSRGPGGQNVNKVSSAAQLTWNFESSQLLNTEEKYRVRQNLKNIINAEGLIYLRSDEFRDLERNKTRSLEKLLSRIAEALFIPKKRRATRPTRSSKVKKAEQKKRHAQTKKMRAKVDY